MSNVIDIQSYKAKKTEKEEYINEIKYYRQCLAKHQFQLEKLLARKHVLFRKYKEKVLKANIKSDKQCIAIYTMLFREEISSFDEGLSKII